CRHSERHDDRDRIDELQYFFHSDRRYAFKLTLSQSQFFRNFGHYFCGAQCGCRYVSKWQSTCRFLRSRACLVCAHRPFVTMSRSACCRRRCARMVNVATTTAYFTGSRWCSARGGWDLLCTRYGSCSSDLNRVHLRPSAGTNSLKEKSRSCGAG